MESRLRYTTALMLAAFLLAIPTLAFAKASAHQSLEDVLHRLVAKDNDTRMEAACELIHRPDGLYSELQAIYESGDTITRRGAIMAMAVLPHPALGSTLFIRAMHDSDPTVRGMAAQSLAIVGPQAAPHMVEALSADSQDTQNAAAFGLSLLGPRAIPALIDGLQSEQATVRSKIAWILGRMEEDATPAVPALIRALDVSDDRAMHIIAEAIDQIGPDPATALHHLKLLNTSEPAPFARIGAQAAPTLVRLLSRPGTPLGQLAFRALADIGAPAENALRQGIHENNLGQQVACALLLLEIDPDAALTLPEEVRAALANSGR